MTTLSRTIKAPAAVASRIMPTSVRNALIAGYDIASFKASGLPPRQLRAWISPLWFDFRDTGRSQLEYFIDVAGLQPSHRVLDIACGVGRIAIPLSTYLNDEGGYEGFDIKKELIEWCQNNISARRKNFQFRVADVATTWNPEGRSSVEDYRFPYPDSTFNLAYAGSIFTHILPNGAKNYLQQTARVLKPGAPLAATWLVYNERSMRLTSTAAAVQRHWSYDCGDFRIKSKEQPEASVAHEEAAVRKMYNDAGFEILEPFRADASYNAGRIPRDRSAGMHLHYSLSILAVRRQPADEPRDVANPD
ncbi:class I SAM-dependent methyltransferase [Bradyrhizobium sp. SYSU BS000235]|uniref:class I SAM-dependent methyltransferase n=1 Tax=Bradyrhizobium sp. SYSU BS000235 TaxID=3411332 RepID=UPI003C737325